MYTQSDFSQKVAPKNPGPPQTMAAQWFEEPSRSRGMYTCRLISAHAPRLWCICACMFCTQTCVYVYSMWCNEYMSSDLSACSPTVVYMRVYVLYSTMYLCVQYVMILSTYQSFARMWHVHAQKCVIFIHRNVNTHMMHIYIYIYIYIYMYSYVWVWGTYIGPLPCMYA